MKTPRVPIGISDFGKLRRERTPEGQSYDFIDKSLMIQDVMEDISEIILITRPRRFGKTMNLSMLQHFLAAQVNGVPTKGLFDDLKIAEHPEAMAHQGKYPVIFLTLKDVSQLDWDTTLDMMRILLRNMFLAHDYLLDSQHLNESEKDTFRKYWQEGETITQGDIQASLLILSRLLYLHHGEKAVILLDEYDTPIQAGFVHGFYQEVVAMIRNMFSAAFKGNDFLKKAMLTGITRISKESLFSGLNNISIYALTHFKFADKFGFTEDEVRTWVPEEYMDKMREWYDGYRFSGNVIYNPWSVCSCIANRMEFAPHWVNTGSNKLIRETFKPSYMKKAHALADGQSITFDYSEHVVFETIYDDESAFWGLLLSAGYLTPVEGGGYTLPNREIRESFLRTMKMYLVRKQPFEFFQNWIDALVSGNQEAMEYYLRTIILESLSFHDLAFPTKESFFHGLLLGLTVGLRDTHIIKSNRESGYGRYDIALIPRDPVKSPGIILEVKVKEDAVAALTQIEEKAYTTELKQHGCTNIIAFGIAFTGKTLTVIGGIEEDD